MEDQTKSVTVCIQASGTLATSTTSSVNDFSQQNTAKINADQTLSNFIAGTWHKK